MIPAGEFVALLVLIIFLSACGGGEDETPETRWKKAYDAGLAAEDRPALTVERLA